MKKPRIVVADSENELDAATAAAEGSTAQAPPTVPGPDDPNVQRDANPAGDGVTISDYIPGQPLDVQNPLHPTPESLKTLNDLRADIHAKQRSGVPHPLPHPGMTRYESRIRIAEAWQYTGQLADAPGWVDRSWAAWGDHDPVRGIDQGPALRVPTPNGRELDKLCRRGDYVVKQEVTLALGVDPDIQIEVWEKENFEKFFLPSRSLGGGDVTAAQPAGHAAKLEEGNHDADAAQQP